MNRYGYRTCAGILKTSPNSVFTVQRCLILESKLQIATKRNYFKEKIIEIVFKVNFCSDWMESV